jgi:hypothetical protein
MPGTEMATRVSDCIDELFRLAGVEFASLDRFPEDIDSIEYPVITQESLGKVECLIVVRYKSTVHTVGDPNALSLAEVQSRIVIPSAEGAPYPENLCQMLRRHDERIAQEIRGEDGYAVVLINVRNNLLLHRVRPTWSGEVSKPGPKDRHPVDRPEMSECNRVYEPRFGHLPGTGAAALDGAPREEFLRRFLRCATQKRTWNFQARDLVAVDG